MRCRRWPILVAAALVTGRFFVLPAALDAAGTDTPEVHSYWIDEAEGEEGGVYKTTIRGQRIRIQLVALKVGGRVKYVLDPPRWIGRLRSGRIVGNHLSDDRAYLKNGRTHRHTMIGSVDAVERRIRLDYTAAVHLGSSADERTVFWSLEPRRKTLMPWASVSSEQMGII